MTSTVERSSAPAWTPDGARPDLLVRADKHDAEYAKSWDWGDGEYLCEQHERILDEIAGFEGLGYAQDALKLYELAWFTPGDVLEIGTFRGRSTATMAHALATSGNPGRVISLDIDAGALERAGRDLARAGLGNRVTLACGTAATVLARMPDLRPGLVFVDGDHTFRGVSEDLAAIAPLLPNGSILVLHDYEGYEEPDPFSIRVREAAGEAWPAFQAEFIGRFGLCGAFVRRSGGPRALEPGAPPAPMTLALGPGRVSAASGRVVRALEHRGFHLRRRLGRG